MKKILSLLLLLTLIVSSCCIYVFADDAPFTVETTQSGDTVTVSVKTNKEITFYNFSLKLEADPVFTLTKISEGADFSDFGFGTPTSNTDTGIAVMKPAVASNDNKTVEAGKEVLTFTYSGANAAAANSYAFNLTVNAAGDVDGNNLLWNKSTASGNLTISAAPPADGYTVAISSEALKDGVAKGDRINVNLDVTHSDETITNFNTFTGILNYDTQKVKYTGSSSAGSVTANQFNVEDKNGILNISRIGNDAVAINKDNPELILSFEALADEGNATFTLSDEELKVDQGANMEKTAPKATPSGSPLTVPLLKSYSIKFAAGAEDATGTTTITPDSVKAGTVIQLPSCGFTREGYDFSKWSDGSREYSAGAEYTVSGNVTFTATWTQNPAVPTPTGSVVSNKFLSGFDLIGATVSPEGPVPAYNNASMINVKGGKYNDSTYYYVIEKGTFAAGNLSIASDSAETITINADDYDVNESGVLDINDAQFVYNIYNNNVTPSEHPEKRRLLADANRDQEVNVQDCATIITAIFAKN